jgi:hypothetical protein
MKNKKLLWILLPAVLAIWGMIGWKIYSALNESEDVAEPVENALLSATDSAVVPDSYELFLDYRDPFLGERVKQAVAVTKTNASNTNVAKPLPDKEKSDPLPTLFYYGLVKETSSNKMVGFLQVNSQTYFVKQNDVIGEVKVGRIWSDSVEIYLHSKKLIVSK